LIIIKNQAYSLRSLLIFTGKSLSLTEMPPKAAIIREKEVTQNVKWLMPYLAGFDVKTFT
jgi:hypothetical protein